jgi:5-carboxymethyl-2-hydroxymuconic-semialdehyde dehydrogenase
MTMKINHLINGRSVAGQHYFETVNPATQDVLAEVASGGEAEVNSAVAAAYAAFPKWAATPATERAKIMRKLGDLITQHVPEIAQTETRDCGQTISQTGKQLVPRAADNFHYFAEMCTRVDGHTYPTPTHLNYTLFHPVGVCALISPWNVPFMTATWKVAPCLAFGNTAVLKMSELSPMTCSTSCTATAKKRASPWSRTAMCAPSRSRALPSLATALCKVQALKNSAWSWVAKARS